ncbi:hypothetical protein ACLOJK_024947 [Asimina triloba]
MHCIRRQIYSCQLIIPHSLSEHHLLPTNNVTQTQLHKYSAFPPFSRLERPDYQLYDHGENKATIAAATWLPTRRARELSQAPSLSPDPYTKENWVPIPKEDLGPSAADVDDLGLISEEYQRPSAVDVDDLGPISEEYLGPSTDDVDDLGPISEEDLGPSTVDLGPMADEDLDLGPVSEDDLRPSAGDDDDDDEDDRLQ